MVYEGLGGAGVWGSAEFTVFSKSYLTPNLLPPDVLRRRYEAYQARYTKAKQKM